MSGLLVSIAVVAVVAVSVFRGSPREMTPARVPVRKRAPSRRERD